MALGPFPDEGVTTEAAAQQSQQLGEPAGARGGAQEGWVKGPLVVAPSVGSGVLFSGAPQPLGPSAPPHLLALALAGSSRAVLLRAFPVELKATGQGEGPS